jgi:glyoxylase-like metal-dependent hydrolase (beta-lactamase superfamily II)
MTPIKTINVSLPFKMGSVNCYLIENDSGYILIDTGSSNKRAELEGALESAGCKPGNLRLIILTHGDFDHTGNAAYLCHKFGAQVAIHRDDLAMVERGEMFVNRKQPNILIRKLVPALFGFGKSKRFTPEVFVEDGQNFNEYGFDAKAISLPGHSMGSIGILTASGDLFCGDLLMNQEEPTFNSIMDDLDAAHTSVEKLKTFKINTVYPGHGKPFQMEQFLRTSE